MGKKRTRVVITNDRLDTDALIAVIESQGNTIPPAIASVLRLVAPILARLVIRKIARTSRKHFSKASINATSSWAGSLIQTIIERATGDASK